jgi:acyl transferase domain-containing protein/surfactin synthase thioesterase subunit
MLQKKINRDEFGLLVRSLNAIEMLQKELRQRKKREQETIAVIGMACRFPGGCTTPEKFWRFLMGKNDGMIEVPAERWNHMDFYDPDLNAKGKAYVREAGFLQQDISLFDAAFFGISPREAEDMDPQQRLLLETCWEALERACLRPDKLKGSKTGVFIGIMGSEFATLPRDHNEMSLYSATGSLANIASGRLAYVLGLQGPAISIDTACSSSLVSTHLACVSLLSGESDLAIAGGVVLMLSPFSFVGLCSLKALAKDGRCKPFDAMGDGYGRGEGCGLVVLKRMSDAVRDGDQILAVIKGSAVNNDGAASGLTVPNGRAQQDVTMQALRKACVLPDDIDFLEAHGTGTPLGDPIEIQAITDVFGRRKDRERPLQIGTVKGHIGHLEAAAGIASLIKVILSIKHKMTPPTINLTKLNPRIHLEHIPGEIPQQPRDWNVPKERLRVSGISSFGFSGTNAHVVVAEAPTGLNQHPTESGWIDGTQQLFTLSARTEPALKELVARYMDYLKENPGVTLPAICYSANTGRMHFPWRIAIIGENLNDLKSKLQGYLESGGKSRFIGESRIFVSDGNDNPRRHRLTFLFGGNSDLIMRAIKQLYDSEPVFHEAFNQCNKLFMQHLNEDLTSGFTRESHNSSNLSQLFRECCLFAVEYSLGQLWESWGIQPDAVLGEKTGEIAAACISGMMPHAAACGRVVDPGRQYADDLGCPRIRFVSGATGESLAKKDISSTEYWQYTKDNETDWKKAISYLNRQGYRIMLGINLEDGSVDKIIKGLPQDEIQFRTLPLHKDIRLQLIQALAWIYCLGADVNWDNVYQKESMKKLILPTYPFQRNSFWIKKLPFASSYTTVSSAQEKDTVISGISPRTDPFEGEELSIPLQNKIISYRISRRLLPEISDTHGVMHVGFYQEILNRAMQRLYKINSYTVAETEYILALYIPENDDKHIQLVIGHNVDGTVQFQFFSYNDQSSSWILHVQGRIVLTETHSRATFPPMVFDEIIGRCESEYSGLMFYQILNEFGLRLGPSVQWIEHLWYSEREALARFRLPLKSETWTAYGLGVPPGVHDACTQLFYIFLPKKVAAGTMFMTSRWKGFSFNMSKRSGGIWCHVQLEKFAAMDGRLKGACRLYDGTGHSLACIEKCWMKEVDRKQKEAMTRALQQIQTKDRAIKDMALLQKLKKSDGAEQKRILQNYLRKGIAEVLNMPENELAVGIPLLDVGMDSLVGYECKAKIEKALEISLPMQILAQGTSIDDLAVQILSIMGLSPLIQRENETEKSDENSVWFPYRKRSAESKFYLYCLPPGGMGASVFQSWSKVLPDFIEVCPIQMPGKETRLEEEPIANIETAVEAIKNVLLSDIKGQYGFFGHSLGALIAYQLAARMVAVAPIRPQHLYVAAYSAPRFDPNPHLKNMLELFKADGFTNIPEPTSLGNIEPDKLRTIIRTVFPGVPELTKNDLIQVMTFLLADVKIVESYRYKPELNFDVPITAFHGKYDVVVKEFEMKAWEEITSASFKLHIMDGDHLFLKDEREQTRLLNHIGKDLLWQFHKVSN